MNGEAKSSIEEKSINNDVELDNFENDIGLPKITNNYRLISESSKILEIDSKSLMKMDSNQLGEIVFNLSKYSFFIQRIINRETSKATWADEATKRIISPIVSNQKGSSYEERKLASIRGNDAASKTDSLRIKAQLKVERLAFLNNRIETIIKVILSIQAKKNDRRE